MLLLVVIFCIILCVVYLNKQLLHYFHSVTNTTVGAVVKLLNMNAKPVFGSVGPFDPTTQQWGRYVKLFRQYLRVNDITDPEKQVGIFMTTMGIANYDLLEDLMSPVDPASKSLEELIEVLQQWSASSAGRRGTLQPSAAQATASEANR